MTVNDSSSWCSRDRGDRFVGSEIRLGRTELWVGGVLRLSLSCEASELFCPEHWTLFLSVVSCQLLEAGWGGAVFSCFFEGDSRGSALLGGTVGASTHPTWNVAWRGLGLGEARLHCPEWGGPFSTQKF